MKLEKVQCQHCGKFSTIGGRNDSMLCHLGDDLIDHPHKWDVEICGRCFDKRSIENNVEYWTEWLNRRFPVQATERP